MLVMLDKPHDERSGKMDTDKTLSIMGLFDKKADDAFRGLRSELLKKGVPAVDQRPHLTFGIYSGIDRRAFSAWLAAAVRNKTELELNFDHIGIFRQGVCFAEPCANAELLRLHRSLHARYDRNCSDKDCLYSLKANSWVPHTTLAVAEPVLLADIVPHILEVFRPINATITRLVITEYPPVKVIAEFSLLKRRVN